MSQDIFISLGPIKGESLDSKHKDEIEVLGWNWQIHQQSSMHNNKGGGTGKATVEDLEFEHFIDKASPNIMQYCLKGTHIDKVVLTVRKAGDNPLDYFTLTMEDVVITKVAPSAILDGKTFYPKEKVSLSFTKIKSEYKLQDEKGGNAGTVAAGFNIKENAAVA
jgi:type VI secretion system secreted protein Hcp